MHFFKITIVSITLLFLLVFYASAAYYTPYASVTASTSNISMLTETMYNQSDFDPFKDWVGIRTGQYDYSIFYNIDNGSCTRLRYYGITNNYNTDWYLSKTVESNFSYNRGNFTVVGNTEDCLGVSSYREFFFQNILIISVPAILIVSLLFCFRVRKRGVSL